MNVDCAELRRDGHHKHYSGKNALRLLPRQLYRYETSGDEILDGALFAMVLGTSVEAVLLVEARTIGDGCRWQYCLAALSPCETVAAYKERQVWSVPFRPYPQSPDRAFFSDRFAP